VAVDPWRVAQIAVERGPGQEGLRGSGYLIAPGRVLTAAHVMAGAVVVRVRLDLGKGTRIDVLAERWWADPSGHQGTDLAVITIPEAATAGRAVEPTRFGRISDCAAVLKLEAFGFPLFKLRDDPGSTGRGGVFRDFEQASGHCPVAANRRQGTLAVYLDDPPPGQPPEGEPSPWAGMSGGPVLAGSRIVGVVAEHHPGEGTGRLTARRIDRAYQVLPVPDLSRLIGLLGLPSAPSELPDVVPRASIDEIDATPHSPEYETPFTPRPELAKWLEEVWRIPPSEWEWKCTQRVCVIGDAGTGKSRLVREHTASENPVWIDAELDESMVAAMADLLSKYEQDITGLKPGSIRKLFGKLLTRADGPALVVVDGILDPEQLDQFIPRNTYARIVVTSRKSPYDDDWAPVIRVADMTSDEAERMVAALLPGRTEVDCRSLAVTFGHRPLIIEHGSAAFTRDGTDDVEAFCRSVSEDAATAISDIADKANKTDRALTAIYRHLVRCLDRDEPEALKLLEMLAFVIPQWVPAEFCMAYLLGLPYVRQREVRFAQRRYDVAVRPLEKYSLIVTDEVLGISIPLLTQRILRGIFTQRMVDILPRLQKLVNFTPETLYAEGWLHYTVGGRIACLAAFTLYGIEKATDGGRLEFEGEVGSARWGYMTEALWQRCVALQNLKGYLLAQVSGEPNVDWDAFVESRKHFPRVQLAEAEALAAFEKKQRESYDAMQLGQRTAPTSARKAVENVLDALYENFGRYQESPLGTIDFGKVPLYFPEELRGQFMRDMEAIFKEHGYGDSLARTAARIIDDIWHHRNRDYNVCWRSCPRRRTPRTAEASVDPKCRKATYQFAM
jgi:hypothetical protein